MNFEKKINKIEQKENEPKIEVLKGSEAPEESRKNPFYSSYFWAMADWENKKLYLPDNSDEAISFSVAAHELGHLVNRGRIQPSRFEFEPGHKEELRAWKEGWQYLEKHLSDYYGQQDAAEDLLKIKNRIEEEFLRITKLTAPFYKKTELSPNEQRGNFLSTTTGKEIKKSIDELRDKVAKIVNELDLNQYLNKIDWNKYKEVVNKALLDIEKDNEENFEN